MEQEIDGVYSRMYQVMSDHKRGLISFDEVLQLWKEEARMIRECHAKNTNDRLDIQGIEAA